MKRSIAITLLLTIIVIMLIIYLAPSSEDFDPENPYWNGFSNLYTVHHPQLIKDILDERLFPSPSNTALLIIGPERNFTGYEALILRRFLEAGGRIILADDFGSGNELLELLGVDARLNGSLLVDPLFKERNMKFPRIRDVKISGVDEIVFNYATIIEGCQNPLALSSSYSFLDLNMNGEWDEGEPKGPFTVACRLNVGEGSLIIISDSSIWINSMLEMKDNHMLLEKLIGNRTVMMDYSHRVPSRLTSAKSMVESLIRILATPEARYAILVGVILVITRYGKGIRAVESEVEKILMRNPTWDKELLLRLERERRR